MAEMAVWEPAVEPAVTVPPELLGHSPTAVMAMAALEVTPVMVVSVATVAQAEPRARRPTAQRASKAPTAPVVQAPTAALVARVEPELSAVSWITAMGSAELEETAAAAAMPLLAD
jgi:hypothetical protein